MKNNSYYFKFSEKEAKKVYENIKYQMKATIEDIQIEYSKNDYRIGFVNNNDNNNLFINSNILMYKKKDMNLRNLFEKWQNWEMSTLKFLMFCICNKTIQTIALKKFPSEECLNHTFLKVEDNGRSQEC